MSVDVKYGGITEILVSEVAAGMELRIRPLPHAMVQFAMQARCAPGSTRGFDVRCSAGEFKRLVEALSEMAGQLD